MHGYLYTCFEHPISRKTLVPNLQAKIHSANQIAIFLNQQYLKNELTNYSNDLTANSVKKSSQQQDRFF